MQPKLTIQERLKSPFSMVELAKFYGVSTNYLLGLTEQKITQTQSWTPCIWVMMQSKY